MKIRRVPHAAASLLITLTFFLLSGSLSLRAEDQPVKTEKEAAGKTRDVHKIDVKIGSDTETQPQSPAGPDAILDPFLSDSRDVFAEIQELQSKVQKLFAENLGRPILGPSPASLIPSRVFEPPLNIEDRGDAIAVTMDLPGMRKENIEITVKDGIVTVSGHRESRTEERRLEKEKKIYRRERFSGGFKRSFRFPVAVDESKVSAQYEAGVLTIRAAKAKVPVEEGKRIRIE